jgi:lipooligosaccharide transport system ATP-binding protein
MAVIKTSNVTKKFGSLVAVNNLDLEVEEGQCFGLLGPNGAGKTSLIKMLTATSPPTEGNIWILGKDLKTDARQVKDALGLVPQVDNLDTDLTVIQNLITFARYFNIPKNEAIRRSKEVLHLFQLDEKTTSTIHELSGGMKRRLLIARGLINNPKLIVLDEPTIGLDPQAKYLVWQKLTELKSQQVSVLLCTQNMEEAEVLCDRVAIMHEGRIMGLDTPQALVSQYVGNQVWEIDVSLSDKETIMQKLTEKGFVFEDIGNKIHIFHVDEKESIETVFDSPRVIRHRPATLEDVFFRLTGRSLAE